MANFFIDRKQSNKNILRIAVVEGQLLKVMHRSKVIVKTAIYDMNFKVLSLKRELPQIRFFSDLRQPLFIVNFNKNYSSDIRLFILYMPGFLSWRNFAARSAPTPKISLDIAIWFISIISSLPANITEWSPTIVPPLTA